MSQRINNETIENETIDNGSLPQEFVACMIEQMGGDAAQRLFDALDDERSTTIRVNRDKCSGVDELSVLKEIESERVPWSSQGYYLTQRPKFTYDSAFHAGAYYVQEASSHFVGHILECVEGDMSGKRVLDTCAAPGGKTTLYSTLVGSEGLVVAGEINRGRASVLADNARKWGLGNIVVVNSDVEPLAKFEMFYDVVAIDAPCSGEGMFRKMSQARDEWSPSSVGLCAKRQGDILRTAWGALKSGGVLIYSTCTFNRWENEGALEEFERWCDGEVCEAEEVVVADSWGVEKGQQGSFQTFRFTPSKSRGEGFFVAVARKRESAQGRRRTPKGVKKIFAPLSKADAAECGRWVVEASKMKFYAVGDTVYGYSAAQSDVVVSLGESLNVIYSGVAMGEVIKGRLNPNGALALFAQLRREQLNVARLESDEMLSYLRRGDVAAERFTEGVNLVTDVDGFAMGFAKRVGGRVNNRYLNSLRIIK